MKFLTLLLTLLPLCNVATALDTPPTVNSSWEEIKKAAPKYLPAFSTIFIKGLGITVDELCISEDQIRPIQPYRTLCVQRELRHHNCIKEEKVFLSTSRVHTVSRCKKWNSPAQNHCIEEEHFQEIYPSQYTVSVNMTRPRGNSVELFKKKFEIPACE